MKNKLLLLFSGIALLILAAVALAGCQASNTPLVFPINKQASR